METSQISVPVQNQQQSLVNKVVLVTGGARGLGEAISRTLCEAGASVHILDNRRDLAEKTARTLCERGGQAQSHYLDIRLEEEVQALISQIQAESGRIDVLINNAAIDKTVPFEELSIHDWDTILATNLRGPFLASKAVFPCMRAQQRGHIVNIVSTASKRTWGNAEAYHASKWGLLGFSHSLHAEARAYGIKVTAIVAGGMRTPFLLERFPEIDPDVLQDAANVAKSVQFALMQPDETVIPEMMVIPMKETSWP